MRPVGLEVLKSKLREYIRLVGSGEPVLVTDRGRVVAELRPPQGARPADLQRGLADAVRRGWLSAPLVVREGLPPRAPIAPLQTLLNELDADRADR